MKIKRRDRYLKPIDRDALNDLIALYSRLHARNVGEFGVWSKEAVHASKILGMFREVRRGLETTSCQS